MRIFRYFKYFRYYFLHLAHLVNGQANMNMHTNGEVNILRKVLGKKSKVLDIGINEGEWLDEAIKVATDKNSSFVGIDADPVSLSLTGKKYSTVPQVKLIDTAVSDEIGTATFYGGASTFGANSLYKHYYLKDDEANAFEVPVSTIDKLIEEQNWDVVDFVKIDIEGSEVAALRGATESFKQKKIKYLQFEYNQTWIISGTSLADVWKICEEHDYRLFRIFSNKLFEITSYHYSLDDFVFASMLMVPSGSKIDIPIVKDWRPV